MQTETTAPAAVRPAAGDLILSANQSTVWLWEATGTRQDRLLATSWTVRRARGLFIKGPDGKTTRTTDAPDFTPRRASDAAGALYLIAKYFPELAGRRLWLNHYRWYDFGTVPAAPLKVKAPRRAVETVPPERQTFIPGAILYCSWGYDQTNVDYYIITRRAGCWVWLQQIGANRTEDTAYMSGTSTPDQARRIGQEFKRRVRVYEGREYAVSIESYSSASLWDGKPKHWTAYA